MASPARVVDSRDRSKPIHQEPIRAGETDPTMARLMAALRERLDIAPQVEPTLGGALRHLLKHAGGMVRPRIVSIRGWPNRSNELTIPWRTRCWAGLKNISSSSAGRQAFEAFDEKTSFTNQSCHGGRGRFSGGFTAFAAHSLRVGEKTDRPPSTTISWPVIQRARSEDKNSTASAMSSGRPKPSG